MTLTQQVYYSLQDRRQLPVGLDWLTAAERARLDGFRFDKRRRDWLLGRWTAKQTLASVAGLSDADIGRIEIGTATDGVPLPRLDGKAFEGSLSLSHSKDRAVCAISRDDIALGCDIELIEARGAAFVETYFTAAEARQVEDTDERRRTALITTIWSTKESVLKALRIGLGTDTRSVEIVLEGDFDGNAAWETARAVTTDAGEFDCRWKLDAGFVVTVAAQGLLEIPVPIPAAELAAGRTHSSVNSLFTYNALLA